MLPGIRVREETKPREDRENKEVLVEEVTLEQKLAEGEGGSHEDTGGRVQ